MLNKKQFVDIMNKIIIFENQLERIRELDSNLPFFIINNSLIDPLIELLEVSMGLTVDKNYGTVISWWIYDCQCGKKKLSAYIEKSKRKIKYDLATPEKLYNYILKCKEK